jgi:Domain of unknown function (DUF222)
MCQAISDKAASSCTDDELKGEIDSLDGIYANVSARRLLVVAELDRRRAFEGDGAKSMADWITARSQVSHSSASQLVAVASKADEMPLIADAVAAGEISYEMASQVAQLVDKDNVEEVLDAASSWSESEARLHVRRNKEITKAEQQEVCRSRSIKTWWNRDKTMLVVNGQLPASGGATLEVALARVMESLPQKEGETYVPFNLFEQTHL